MDEECERLIKELNKHQDDIENMQQELLNGEPLVDDSLAVANELDRLKVCKNIYKFH